MSLVLNTNESGGGGYEMSNANIGIYPDFKNSALITPPESVNVGAVPSNYTVNGTTINFRSGTLVAPDFFTQTSNYGQVNVFYTTGSSSAPHFTGNFRVGIPAKLNGGEVVGKMLMGGLAGFFINPYSWQSSSRLSGTTTKFDIYAKLLHTDGTLTTIGKLDLSGLSASATDNSQQIFIGYDTTKAVETNGVVALKGDIIVADYDIELSGTISSGSCVTFGCILGFRMSADDSRRMRPFQISID